MHASNQPSIFQPTTPDVRDLYAARAAADLRQAALERKPEYRERLRTFLCDGPNDKGNYVAKRIPRKRFNGGTPLEPRERFARLAAAYLAFAQCFGYARRSKPAVTLPQVERLEPRISCT